MNNPFTVSFGKRPQQYISRIASSQKIVDAFVSDTPTTQVYMLTGVRGSGKTVLMTAISNELCSRENWLALELNSEGNLLEELASKMMDIPSLQPLFITAKIDLSLLGIGMQIEGSKPISNIESALERMLHILKKHKKKLLITIDEVTSTSQIKRFTSAFQIFMRKDFDVFLIMTGLYENIYNLQNEKTLTFLYRAPKIILDPLNTTAIADSYRKVFQIDAEEAFKMAALTRGYAFAYQLLGFIRWEHMEEPLESLYSEYDQYLEEYVYEKIWFELSQKDILVLEAIAATPSHKVKDILTRANMSASLFSTYRSRLIKKGLINASQYGQADLVLPRFSEFIMRQKILIESYQ